MPQAADALVGLAAEINSMQGPIIVHCSAGIGRTGCFIGLANGMTQLVREGSVDILGILCQMRYVEVVDKNVHFSIFLKNAIDDRFIAKNFQIRQRRNGSNGRTVRVLAQGTMPIRGDSGTSTV